MTALKVVTASTGARRRMATVAALAAGVALVLTGCSAGQIAQTAEQASAVNGNNADVNAIALRDVHIIFPTDSQANKALLALSIVNSDVTTPDELISVSTDLGAVQITAPDGGNTVTLPPQQTVVMAGSKSVVSATDGSAESTVHAETPAPAADHAAIGPGEPALIEITDLTENIIPGLTYSVTFNFKNNGTVALQVPVDAGPETQRHLSGSSSRAEEAAGGGH